MSYLHLIIKKRLIFSVFPKCNKQKWDIQCWAIINKSSAETKRATERFVEKVLYITNLELLFKKCILCTCSFGTYGGGCQITSPNLI